MRRKLTFATIGLLGFVLGAQSAWTMPPGPGGGDLSCCIYQGQNGLYCINWYSGNTVDCLACPRGPQDC